MRKAVILIAIFVIFAYTPYARAESLKEVFMEGEKFFFEGNYEEAIENYEKAIEIEPNFAEAYNRLGSAYREIGVDPLEVAWYFKAAINIKPKFAEAYVNLSRISYNIGRFDEAEEYCLKVLSIYPDLGSAQLSLAWIYLMGKQKPKNAIHYFKKVLEKSKMPYAYFGLGLAYFMDEQRAMVLEAITTLRSIDKEDLAVKLEEVIRGKHYVSTQLGPLVNKQPYAGQREGIIVPSGIPKGIFEEGSGLGPLPGTPKSTSPIQGVTRIRLKGKMINMPSGESRQEYGDNSIPSPAARIQRIRELQRQSSQYGE